MGDWYPLIKLLHILSSTVLFGTGMGTAFQMWTAHQNGDVPAIARVSRHVVWDDWLFTTPAVIAQPLTGLILIRIAGYSLWEPWLPPLFCADALVVPAGLASLFLCFGHFLADGDETQLLGGIFFPFQRRPVTTPAIPQKASALRGRWVR